jgi:hypothetical protein
MSAYRHEAVKTAIFNAWTKGRIKCGSHDDGSEEDFLADEILDALDEAEAATPDADWPWYADYDNVVELAHWLREEYGFDAAELLAFLDKPWHYESEWQELAARIAEEERADALAKVATEERAS